jgi:osmoprotectant transport system permease protein
MSYIDFFIQNSEQVVMHLMQHIQLTAMAVGLAILVGVPLGIFICYMEGLSKPVLGVSNIIQAIPSMALLGFMIPFLGIGIVPAVVAVMLYSLLPIIKNTYTGISNINPDMIESAKGIGLTKFQVLWKIQIPMALPVIMAGVRISSVTAVGLVTIAAFIGAGGLGFLVFSGIRTVNNAQILAGAIPACLLALLVDYMAGLVEKLVTPISLQRIKNFSEKAQLKRRRHQKIILAIFALAIVALFTYNGVTESRESTEEIVIGAKDFSEQSIVANMVALLIEEKTDLRVQTSLALGGTNVCFGALTNGSIDMYIEYTGTAHGDILGHPSTSDSELILRTIREEFEELYDIIALDQWSFNNTYTLTVRPELAKEHNLVSISDLRDVASQLRLGATFEFLNREDGYPGLGQRYQLSFGETLGIDGSGRYLALMNDEVDIVDAFSTDGLIKKFDLVVLEDDLNFFPPYYAIPLVRSEVLEKHPQLAPLLADLGSRLNNDIMIELNYQVDEMQMNPRDVARNFLIEIGLL